MDLGVRDHDARARRVLDRELGLPALSRQPPNGSRQVLSAQRFDILEGRRDGKTV